MTPSGHLAQLLEAVHAALARAPSNGPLVIAFSGGTDSTALLHVLSHCPAARARGLRALHVDHGLAEQSAAWAMHCETACARLDVPLTVLRVDVRREREGLEGAARRARYDALAGALVPGELLLTAHHADDQAETLLLRLLRGSGVHGVAGMREWRTLAPGFLGRPWLCVPKGSIGAYAADMRLASIVDPSNLDPDHDRNFLRQDVLPRLAARWPHAGEALARSAQLMGSASLALSRRNAALVASLRSDDAAGLKCPLLRLLDDFDLEEVIRTFVAAAGAPSPPARVLALLRSELLDAAEDARPALMWRGHALRRYRDVLYLTTPLAADPGDWEAQWDGRDPLALPAGLGTLCGDAHSPLRLVVRFRRGGERMRVRDDGPDRPVKTLLQELHLPPWQRDVTPLVFDELGVAAIGSLLVSERLGRALATVGARLAWRAARG